MPRAPYQILAFPYRILNGEPRYALFRRNAATGGYWQGIAGGGEEEETPLEAARRESFEEAGISIGSRCIRLDSMAMIPVVQISGFLWGDDVLVIPEYAFGVEVDDDLLVISGEHTEYCWTDYESALAMVKWESNRTALWELNHRLCRHPIRMR
ncbi:MAG: hydrolase [Chlorobi bacterium]|nr:hydrolase [Chlorobiota bacterium]